MAKSKRGGSRGTNSGGSRTSRASNVQGRGPGKSYRIVDEAGAIREAAARGYWIGGMTDKRTGKPVYIGGQRGKNSSGRGWGPAAPQPRNGGRGTNSGGSRSRATRTPQSLTPMESGRYVLPDRPDGTGNAALQSRIPGPWPGGPGTRVVYKGTQFWRSR